MSNLTKQRKFVNVNPFLYSPNASLEVIDVYTNKSFHEKLPDGTSSIETRLINKYQVLRRTPTQVMQSELEGKLYSNTTSAGRDLFLYISFNILESKGIVHLDKKKVSISMHSSERTVYRGVTELISQSIIAPTGKKNEYWVNPFYVFRGNVIEYMKSHETNGQRIEVVHSIKRQDLLEMGTTNV